MPPLRDETNAFYRDNAAAYANRERKAPTARLERFLARLTPGARILELGCGGGQDSAYMLARGFDVTPTDGSPELAAEAERLLGRQVEVVRFDEIAWRDVFDAVWAEACLLHVPRAELAGVLARILRALRGGGILHASFKAGNGEGHDRFGRYFNYPSRDWLMPLFNRNGWANVDILEADGGGYDGEPTRWLHVSAAKPISAKQ
ncbi:MULTISPECIES: class I SAM-dependent methyltransferase [unclassified Sinorhizobium]|uniref:class I SAM-dependent methyltransferase n=1 Tax=unclassified Sinorhizobium TaxID=2613772 RepID=UPI0024C41DB7|nr:MULTISPECIES: class I SAM-dependent methyltransferase [unclassified Sinorhizobium]MDK1378527.1 class I SAM-dependent methyltransferase [Sinorhizobium sp. 6-70]MDK1480587.1 class I SAM-dependent methyltransferase [Sinorhizobium sp. 6-117]